MHESLVRLLWLWAGYIPADCDNVPAFHVLAYTRSQWGVNQPCGLPVLGTGDLGLARARDAL